MFMWPSGPLHISNTTGQLRTRNYTTAQGSEEEHPQRKALGSEFPLKKAACDEPYTEHRGILFRAAPVALLTAEVLLMKDTGVVLPGP